MNSRSRFASAGEVDAGNEDAGKGAAPGDETLPVSAPRDWYAVAHDKWKRPTAVVDGPLTYEAAKLAQDEALGHGAFLATGERVARLRKEGKLP